MSIPLSLCIYLSYFMPLRLALCLCMRYASYSMSNPLILYVSLLLYASPSGSMFLHALCLLLFIWLLLNVSSYSRFLPTALALPLCLSPLLFALTLWCMPIPLSLCICLTICLCLHYVFDSMSDFCSMFPLMFTLNLGLSLFLCVSTLCLSLFLYVSISSSVCPSLPSYFHIFLYVSHSCSMSPSLPLCLHLFLYVSISSSMSAPLPLCFHLFLYVSHSFSMSPSLYLCSHLFLYVPTSSSMLNLFLYAFPICSMSLPFLVAFPPCSTGLRCIHNFFHFHLVTVVAVFENLSLGSIVDCLCLHVVIYRHIAKGRHVAKCRCSVRGINKR
jgi:hypothetical protein